MAKTREQKRRAAEYTLRVMMDRNVSKSRLLAETELDPATLRTFLAGDTWPQTQSREAVEVALGLPVGTLELAADGLVSHSSAESDDPVEAAIQSSRLTRGNKARLIGIYFDMLDSQQERGAS